MKKPLFRTPHPSAKGMTFPKLSKRVVIRHGASKNSKPAPVGAIEINSLEAIRNNSDKFKMKEIFQEVEVRSPECFENTQENREIFKQKGWNVVFKKRRHKRSQGMEFLKVGEIDKLSDPIYEGGLLERRINIRREWRVHCAPALDRFFAMEKRKRLDHVESLNRNLETCVFRKDFDEPDNWQEALTLTKKAIEAMGLDVACVDLAWSGKFFYIIETNAASGLGEETKAWYEQCYREVAEIKTQNA